MDTVKGTTKTGFEFEIDPEVLDDWEVLDQLAEMSEGNLLVAPRFAKKVLGAEEAKKLAEHCRTEGGRVPTQVMLDELFDIFGQIKEGKN